MKTVAGFHSLVILNNDGIVIKYENMSYKDALHYAHQVLSLSAKASKYTRDLFDAPDNEVESIRLKTVGYEMIVAQHGNFTMIVNQSPVEVVEEAVAGTEGAPKEGEEKKEAPKE